MEHNRAMWDIEQNNQEINIFDKADDYSATMLEIEAVIKIFKNNKISGQAMSTGIKCIVCLF